jgi:hypothetical protein
MLGFLAKKAVPNTGRAFHSTANNSVKHFDGLTILTLLSGMRRIPKDRAQNVLQLMDHVCNEQDRATKLVDNNHKPLPGFSLHTIPRILWCWDFFNTQDTGPWSANAFAYVPDRSQLLRTYELDRLYPIQTLSKDSTSKSINTYTVLVTQRMEAMGAVLSPTDKSDPGYNALYEHNMERLRAFGWRTDIVRWLDQEAPGQVEVFKLVDMNKPHPITKHRF